MWLNHLACVGRVLRCRDHLTRRTHRARSDFHLSPELPAARFTQWAPRPPTWTSLP
jgi:hypothetical protein